MPLMLYHTVHSQLIRIGKTDLTHSTLKRLIRCSSIPILVSQDSFFSSKNATKILNYIIAPDTYKPLNFSTRAYDGRMLSPFFGFVDQNLVFSV